MFHFNFLFVAREHTWKLKTKNSYMFVPNTPHVRDNMPTNIHQVFLNVFYVWNLFFLMSTSIAEPLQGNTLFPRLVLVIQTTIISNSKKVLTWLENILKINQKTVRTLQHRRHCFLLSQIYLLDVNLYGWELNPRPRVRRGVESDAVPIWSLSTHERKTLFHTYATKWRTVKAWTRRLFVENGLVLWNLRVISPRKPRVSRRTVQETQAHVIIAYVEITWRIESRSYYTSFGNGRGIKGRVLF